MSDIYSVYRGLLFMETYWTMIAHTSILNDAKAFLEALGLKCDRLVTFSPPNTVPTFLANVSRLKFGN